MLSLKNSNNTSNLHHWQAMANTFSQIPLNIHQRLALEANPICITELADGGYLLNFNKDPHVIRLDSSLKQVWKKDLQAQTINYVNCMITASPDGKMMALSGNETIRILDLDANLLWALPHEPWGKFLGSPCAFSSDGQLIWFIIPGSSTMENDILYAVKACDYKVADTWMMDGNQDYNYMFYATPDNKAMIIEAAAGQDASLFYRVRLEDGKISCEELSQCHDRIMGSFSPDGREFVTAPHHEDGIELFSFPEITKTAVLESDELFAERNEYPTTDDGDSVEYVVLYVNNKTLLTFTRFGRLLLIDRESLSCRGELLPEGCEIRAYDMAGRPTTNPNAVIDYAGEIVTVALTKQHQLLLTHNSGEVRTYNLPETLF